MEAPQIPNIEFTILPSHSDCPITYTFRTLDASLRTNITATSSSDAPEAPDTASRSIIWFIFVNGLGLLQAFWQPTIQLLESDFNLTKPDPSLSSSHYETICITTFDRHGQGLSRPPNPTDTWKPTPHTCFDAAAELAELISFLSPHITSSITISSTIDSSSLSAVRIILIGHSLGIPIIRLFMTRDHCSDNLDKKVNAKIHINISISGLILIDSNMANINMVDLLPDPNDPSIDISNKLPSDTTLDQLRSTRENYSKLFAPLAPNAENIDRVSLLTSLPKADKPLLSPISIPPSPSTSQSPSTLPSSKCNQPRKKRNDKLALTIIAHDPVTLAEEGLRISTKGLTGMYIEPAWQEYNLRLIRLNRSRNGDNSVEIDREDDEEIVVAKGAGHFGQRDNPRCVADEVWKMVRRIS